MLLALERLERCDGKLSRTVLRGGSNRKVAPLPCTIDYFECVPLRLGKVQWLKKATIRGKYSLRKVNLSVP